MGRQEMKLVTSTVIHPQAERRKGNLIYVNDIKDALQLKGTRFINRQK